MKTIKLNIHPDKSNERSQYIRLYLEEFLIENGIKNDKIIWRTPYILSFTPDEMINIPSHQWAELINQKFNMNLSSVYKAEIELV